MKTSNLGLFAVAAAIALVGALLLGAPLGSLVVLAVVLACPLMMIFMMNGMHGDEGSASEHHDSDHRRDPRSHH
jgi:type III secretory pathway component EscV